MFLLELKNISKSFGGVKALKNVSFDINYSEVHSIIGENGAGKSTLMKIISGVIKSNEGEIIFEGERVNFKSPKESESKGIFIVHQEPFFFPNLTALENIFAGNEILKNGFLDLKAMQKKAKVLIDKIGLNENVLHKNMNELSLGDKQMIMIVRSLLYDVKLLILDEPTSILSYDESQRLFSIIKELKAAGKSILYISHRISDIMYLSDKITVLKDGMVTKNLDVSEANEKNLINYMSGRDINTEVYKKRDYENEEYILKVDNLTNVNYFRNISFKIKKKEILGFYGLVGSGRTELFHSIIGELKYSEGEIEYKNNKYIPKDAKQSYADGIVYLTEDRVNKGIFDISSIKINLGAGIIEKKCSKFSFINKLKENDFIKDAINKYSIKIGSVNDFITTLSGGNQQKILFSRCMSHDPDILILDEPTRGIDIKTKTDIYDIIMNTAMAGTTIIVISSDISEIMSISDRIIVLHEGEQVGEINRDKFSEAEILKMALGN